MYKEFEWADAIYTDPTVSKQEVLRLSYPNWPGDDDRYDFDIIPTKANCNLLLPIFNPGYGKALYPHIRVGDKDMRWPIIPVYKYRGGYMTATAVQAVEDGIMPYYTPGGLPILRPYRQVHRSIGI